MKEMYLPSWFKIWVFLGCVVVIAGRQVIPQGGRLFLLSNVLLVMPCLLLFIRDAFTRNIQFQNIQTWLLLFFVAIAASLLYPGTDKDYFDVRHCISILISMYGIQRVFSSKDINVRPFLYLVASVALLIGVTHLYGYFVLKKMVDGNHLSGYPWPRHHLHVAQSYGFPLLATVFLILTMKQTSNASAGFRLDFKYGFAQAYLFCAAGVMLTVCYLTHARSFVTALVGTVALVSVLMSRRVMWLAVFGAISFVAYVLIMRPSYFFKRDIIGRAEIWQIAFDYINKSPIWGYGSSHSLLFVRKTETLNDPHNIVLAVWINYGLFAVVAFACWLLSMFRLVYLQRASSRMRLYAALFIFGLSMLWVEGTNIISRPRESWVLIWIPAALIYAEHFLTAKARQAIA